MIKENPLIELCSLPAGDTAQPGNMTSEFSSRFQEKKMGEKKSRTWPLRQPPVSTSRFAFWFAKEEAGLGLTFQGRSQGWWIHLGREIFDETRWQHLFEGMRAAHSMTSWVDHDAAMTSWRWEELGLVLMMFVSGNVTQLSFVKGAGCGRSGEGN